MISLNHMQNNKNLWIGIGVIVVVVILIIWSMHTGSTTPVATNSNGSPTDTALQSTEDVTAPSIDIGAPAATISYEDALVKYANARIQLDANCQADAQSQKMTFRNNAIVMIDNRAPVARTVKVGTTFSMKAYSFKLIQLSSSTLPATWLVDCDGNQNVATITIQK